jgi:hypothetical protein
VTGQVIVREGPNQCLDGLGMWRADAVPARRMSLWNQALR